MALQFDNYLDEYKDTLWYSPDFNSWESEYAFSWELSVRNSELKLEIVWSKIRNLFHIKICEGFNAISLSKLNKLNRLTEDGITYYDFIARSADEVIDFLFN